MSKKSVTKETTSGDIVRIPVTLRPKDKPLTLAVKQAVEKREGKALSWAYIVRLAFRALAAAEGVKCK